MVTAIRTSSAVEYRCRQECAHDAARQRDAAVSYRIDSPGSRPILRAGSGWRTFDRTPGAPVGIDELDEVRAVMSGCDPRTGEQLVRRKTTVAPEGRLPAMPLLRAMHAQRTRPEAESRAGRLVGRMVRGAKADHSHTVPVADLERVSRSVGIDLGDVYDAQALDYAKAHAGDRVETGVRAWDLTLDTPKSVSILHGLSDPATARRVEDAYLRAVQDTVTAAEDWCGQGQRGQHGHGRTASRVQTEGLIATVTTHTTARPVNGVADPHLHAHVMIAHMARGTDGQWGAIAAGGRELHRHVPALGETFRARLRHHLTEELGVAWERDPRTQRWEVAGIPQGVRDLYSRRRDQAIRAAGPDATPAQRRLAARRVARQKLHGVPEQDQRDEWRQRAQAAGHDPHTLVSAVTGRTRPAAPDVDQLTATTAATAWTRSPTAGVSEAHIAAMAADVAPPGATVEDVHQAAARVAATASPTGGTAGQSGHRGAGRYVAPALSARDAQAGRGPVAQAARRQVQAHQSAAAKARQDAAQHRRRAAHAQETAARTWRPGARRQAEQEAAQNAQAARDAEAQAQRHESTAGALWRRAIDQDTRIARAQGELRAWRSARAAVNLAATDRPPAAARPRDPDPSRGIGPPYRPPPHRRAPGPRGRGPER